MILNRDDSRIAAVWKQNSRVFTLGSKSFQAMINDLDGMEIELDWEIAVKVAPPPNFPMKTLVIECIPMMMVAKFSLAHTLQEGNRVANALAKMGSEQDEKLITLVTAPD